MITYISAAFLALIACSPIAVDDVPEADPIAVPENFAVQQTGLTAARLTWTISSTDFDGLVLERIFKNQETEYTKLAELSKDALIYQDKSLSEDGVYGYKLYAYRGTETGECAEVEFTYSKLPAPTDLTCKMTAEGVALSWKDNCTGEEGYLVRKSYNGENFSDWKALGANVESVTDPQTTSGVYEYEVIAFAGEDRSAAAKVRLENVGEPEIKVSSTTSSWHQVHIQMYLEDDGGNECEAGICWKTDGSEGATVEDNTYVYHSKVKTGDPFFGVALDLVPGKTYSFVPWVKYAGKYKYYSAVSSSMAAEPSSFVADWTDISSQYDMPASIKLYKTTTSVTGRSINAWYAIADMSAGDLELRTFKTSSATKPSVAAKSLNDVQIIVNGGYFGSGQSYSYVVDQGKEVAAGVKAVTRKYYGDANKTQVSKSFNITRGAFGVTEGQVPSVKWLYGSSQWAYDTPLPAYNGGPVFQPTATFPDVKRTWDVYSAIGGGPVILYDSHICIDYLVTRDKGNGGRYIGNPELLDDDIFGPSVRPPRTAIGHTADGKIVIMVVDGRDSGGSKGVALDELARLMKGVGCTYALNLDGGGSTVMCATPSATILNKPSDGSERSVLSFVALVKK